MKHAWNTKHSTWPRATSLAFAVDDLAYVINCSLSQTELRKLLFAASMTLMPVGHLTIALSGNVASVVIFFLS